MWRILGLFLLSTPALAFDLIPIWESSKGEHKKELSASFPVKPHLKAEDFKSDGWYVRATIEVREGSGPLVFSAGDSSIEHDGSPGRVALRTPASDEIEVKITAAGEAPIAWGDLALERYHRHPTAQLFGKANGRLGPDQLSSGALGFVGITEHEHRAFSILSVTEGGPASAAGMHIGDLVTAVEGKPLASSSIAPGWEWFEESHEASLGRAIEAALKAKRDSITLTVERAKRSYDLRLALSFPAEWSEGFPLTGELADALYADLVGWTLRNQKKTGTWQGTDAVNPAVGGLALLGAGKLEESKRALEYLRKKTPEPSKMTGLAYWQISFQGMFFCEHYLATQDESVLGWIEEAALWLPTTTHECKWGMQAFGHGPDGLPYGNKGLMAPAAHLLVFDALARKCGIESRIWEHIEEYVKHSWASPEIGGRGAMGYNASYRDEHEFWSRSGLVAMATALRGEKGRMRELQCLIMAEKHPWMFNSHAYGEPGAALGLMGLAVAHRESFDEVLPHYGWRFLNAWEPGHGLRYSTPHMGAPYMGAESIMNLAYTAMFSVRHGGLVITGK